MSSLAQYGEACDYIRALLTLSNDTSLQDIIVKFTEEYKRVKALKDSQSSIYVTEASNTTSTDVVGITLTADTQTGKLEIPCHKPKKLKKKSKKKSLSKPQRLAKLKKLHSQKKDSQPEKKS